MKIGLQFAMPAEFHALPGAKELEAFETVSGVPFYEAAPGIIACAGGVSKVNAAMGSVLLLWHEAREASVNDPEHAYLPEEDAIQAALEHTSYYNIFTVQGTAASRVFFRIVAKAVRMRESWPDVFLQGP